MGYDGGPSWGYAGRGPMKVVCGACERPYPAAETHCPGCKGVGT